MNLLGLKDKLLKYGWMVAAIALTVLLGVQTARLVNTQIDLADVKTELATEKAAFMKAVAVQSQKLAAAEAKNRKVEQDLVLQAAQTRTQTNDQVRALTARNDSLLERMRRAEARAAAQGTFAGAAAADGQAAQGGDGEELLGRLGAEDVREAQRADTIRLHLASCYRQYDGAQEALRKLNAGSD